METNGDRDTGASAGRWPGGGDALQEPGPQRAGLGAVRECPRSLAPGRAGDGKEGVNRTNRGYGAEEAGYFQAGELGATAVPLRQEP